MVFPAHSPRFAFDRFELDLRSGELRKEGRRVRLQEQPFQFLALLVENAGEVVTREQICRTLWPADTFVDFDHGLAVAVNKIREALSDSADSPRFIETLPKRGYRFIAKVQIDEPNSDHELGASLDAGATNPCAPAPRENGRASKRDSSELEPRLEVFSGRGSGSSSLGAVGREQKRRFAPTVLVTALVVVATGYGVLAFLYRPPRIPFQNATITQVTDSGNIQTAAISPDGKYLLSVTASATQDGLWLRNIATASETQIRLPEVTDFSSLAFSPDSNRFYFVGLAGNEWNLYRARSSEERLSESRKMSTTP